MFANFNRFRKDIRIKNKHTEKAVLTRGARSNATNFKSNFVFTALLEEHTHLENGDVFTADVNGDQKVFLTISVRHADTSIQAICYACNGYIDIFRPTKIYDRFDNLTDTKLKYIESVPTNHMTISGYMRMLDSGLLPSTTKEFRVPVCNIQLLDRIVIDGEFYCVDSIDRTKFDNLLAIQASIDNRNLHD